jgi:hypothetical protein
MPPQLPDEVARIRRDEIVRVTRDLIARGDVPALAGDLGIAVKQVCTGGWVVYASDTYVGLLSYSRPHDCYKAVSYLLDGPTYGSAPGLLRLLASQHKRSLGGK